MTAYRLDVSELYRRLDVQRAAKGMSWRDLATATGTTSSMFSRMAAGHAPDVHGLVSLLVWLDLDTDIAYLIRPGENA